MEVKFEYSGGDAFWGAVWAFFRLRQIRLIYGVLGLALIYGVASSIQADVSRIVSMVLVGCLYGSFPLLAGVFALLAQRRIPEARRRHRYRFSADGVDISSAIGRSQLSWEAFEQANEARGAFYLSPHRNVWHMIPKRAFKDPAALDQFRRLLSTQLGKKARVRPVSNGDA